MFLLNPITSSSGGAYGLGKWGIICVYGMCAVQTRSTGLTSARLLDGPYKQGWMSELWQARRKWWQWPLRVGWLAVEASLAQSQVISFWHFKATELLGQAGQPFGFPYCSDMPVYLLWTGKVDAIQGGTYALKQQH